MKVTPSIVICFFLVSLGACGTSVCTDGSCTEFEKDAEALLQSRVSVGSLQPGTNLDQDGMHMGEDVGAHRHEESEEEPASLAESSKIKDKGLVPGLDGFEYVKYPGKWWRGACCQGSVVSAGYVVSDRDR